MKNEIKPRGFTLLEVMIAVAVASVALLAVYRLQTQTISMNYSIRFYATAPLLAKHALSTFEMEYLGESTEESGDFGREFPGYTWAVSVEEVESELLGKTAERLKQLNVEISFNKDEFIYLFSTYRFAG